MSALSYGTAYFSAVMFIGYAGGTGWKYGLWGILPGIGNAVFGSLLAWMVLARRTRETTRRLKIKSMPQLFEKRFGSQPMKLFCVAVIFIFLLPYSASVYKGLTSVCAVLLKVDVNVAGPSLILSRTSPLFIRRLLEREVSEIHDGVVEIVAIARDPGVRTKIAVRSSDPRIDPVGACVGMRGMRVKNITNELGGERVDVINYSDRIAEYAANALHPAKAEKIEVDENAKVVSFYVTPENSRLAFGKKAQNVKLAQKLVGWKIDIKAAEEAPAEEKTESFDEKKAHITEHLSSLLGISLADAELLVNNGFLSIDGLKAVQVSDLESIEGLSPETVSVIVEKIAKQNTAESSEEE